ncbi:MAG TPA: peptidylprolyl isomerase [Polyangiaceae bacterium]|nr:peptidylprolyl isomerase [Polyangiaceae bacterium]
MTLRPRFRKAPLCGFALALALGLAPVARATVVERIVATVGERAILLSDLKRRAEPFMLQVQHTVPVGAQRNAAISQVYKAVLQKIVDEELLEKAAAQTKLTITPAEIDEGLKRVAAQNKLTVEQVVSEAERAGLKESEYREELRRQLLEAKLLMVRLQGRIRLTEEDVRSAYRKLEVEERGQLGVELAWIVIRSANHGAAEARKLADAAAARARREDFASVARVMSEDSATSANGGALPKARPDRLPPEIARSSVTLAVGQVSQAFRSGGDFVILKVRARDASNLPDYESAKLELAERVRMDKMAQARRNWLDNLRRQHHVEVRL